MTNRRIAQMALYQFGFALVCVFVSGVLNRVMFAELGLPATLIGVLLAIPPLLSPLRLWLGYLSDAYPIRGHRRLPYILGGMVLVALGVASAAWGAMRMAQSTLLGLVVMVVAFVCYGMGKNATATAFQALIADVYDETARSRAVATLKAAFIGGIIAGSVVLGNLLDPFSTDKLLIVALAVGGSAVLFAVLGTLGVEPRGAQTHAASQRARELPFWETLRRIFADRQVRLFFFFIGATLLATLTQDIFLEPYGAQVFGMSVNETTRLSMYWGVGTLGAMMVSGLWLVNRIGRRRVAALGLWIVALTFTSLIITGAIGQTWLFITLVFLLGVGSGVTAAGTLTLMVDFTTPERAGLLMGTWTVAHQLAEAVGNMLGGVVLDGTYALSQSYVAAFGAVFALEVIAALTGLLLLRAINVRHFRR
jgi:BCD family chlorophyll transporter-like MFS transporter